MRFKAGLIIGGAVGYFLGSKAGREPYERLMEMWNDFQGKPEVERIRSEVRERFSEIAHQMAAFEQTVDVGRREERLVVEATHRGEVSASGRSTFRLRGNGPTGTLGAPGGGSQAGAKPGRANQP